MKHYHTYILTNKNNKVLYTKVTNDLFRRIYEHRSKFIEGFTPLEAERPAACRGDECWSVLANAGFNAPRELLTGFTKKYNINKLVYLEEFPSIDYTIAAEKKIKGWLRNKKINLIESKNPEWKDLFLIMQEYAVTGGIGRDF